MTYSLLHRLKAVWCRIYDQNLLVLKQIWSDEYPPGKHKKHTWLEKILLSPPLIGRSLSLSNLVAIFRPGGAPAYQYIDIYLLVWVTGLSVMLFLLTLAPWFVVVCAVYRVADIISYQLCIILIDSQKPNWRLASIRRSFLFAMLNLYEIVVAYALLYLSIGNIVENTNGGLALESSVGAFYYSLVTMVTLGYGEFVPGDDLSRGIVIMHLITELLFLLAVIPLFVSNITRQLGSREFRDPENRSK